MTYWTAPAWNLRLSYKWRDAPQPPAVVAPPPWGSARIASRLSVLAPAAWSPRVGYKWRDSYRPPAAIAWPSARIADRAAAAFEAFRPAHNLRLSWRAKYKLVPPVVVTALSLTRIGQRLSAAIAVPPPRNTSRRLTSPAPASSWPSARTADRRPLPAAALWTSSVRRRYAPLPAPGPVPTWPSARIAVRCLYTPAPATRPRARSFFRLRPPSVDPLFAIRVGPALANPVPKAPGPIVIGSGPFAMKPRR